MKAYTFFFTLVASAITLASVGAQDTFFIQGETQYQGYCGPNAPAPPLGAICFQTSSNINEEVREGSNELTAYTTINGQGRLYVCRDDSWQIRNKLTCKFAEFMTIAAPPSTTGFVVIIGLAGSTGFFTTDRFRVDMVAIDYTAWSNAPCVQYSITDVGAKTASKVGHYCHGQGAVSI